MSVGAPLPRVEGLAKLRGQTRYVDDLKIPGVLHGATVRSPVARGRIRAIHFDPAINWDEFVIVDHRDIPGPNTIAMIEKDLPALAADEVRYQYEPVLLLAHPSMRMLRKALRAVRIEVDPLPAVCDPRQTLSPELVQHGNDNVFKRIDIRKGNPQPAFQNAPHVIEGVYQTGGQEHLYLEPHGMIAYREEGRMVVAGCMQCPYYVHAALTHLFQCQNDEIRVVQTPTGGAFGGKEDYPSILAAHAALLAQKAGRPVKIIYERAEDMAVTTKRHPSWVRHRTAVANDGRLLAMEIEVILDAGAYVTLSPVVLSRGVIHAGGPYACDHVHIHGEARLTNRPPCGAFRGFGAPQTEFAVERHMDVIARTLDLDPIEVRRQNLLRPGTTTATGQAFRDNVDLSALLDRGLEFGHYRRRQAEARECNATHPYLRRGVGLACIWHGSGFTGSGETHLASQVELEAQPDGHVEVLTSQTDFGQGTETILAQVVAGRLGVPTEHVRVVPPDTARVPNSGPTVASRTAMIVGGLLERASENLLNKLADLPGNTLAERIRAWLGAHPGRRLVAHAQYRKPKHIEWDDDSYRGDAYPCYAWAIFVADVEVDLRTYIVRLRDISTLSEVGRLINPALAEGQLQGGMAQGIGWALTEEIVEREGAMINNQMTNYVIPTSADLPPLRVAFEEAGGGAGPSGAKGIGEMPMNGPAPAIVNAVCAALDTSIDRIPLTPERLMQYLEGD